MGETYYELLGVSEDASTDEIEQAYREQLKQTHPDVSDSRAANEQTKQLIEAKETLTDPHERARYDRLGHIAYVGDDTEGTTESAASPTGDTPTSQDETRDASRRQARASGQHGRQAASKQATQQHARRQTTAENVGAGARWAQSAAAEDTGDTAQSADQAYAVERGGDAMRFGGIFRDQHAFVLLGTTFLVYPVLLFGALSPTFPLAVNLFVAACIVFIIAFLQSVPEVGLVVFGGWSVLLPPLLFLWLGIGLLSVEGILALTAVFFPLGLSALTRVAIRPMTAG
ncbi:DnaJ domain-containing protein [Halovenus aranensis]|uniref:DnaJ domain-containing protein n=1 Tax=Halovenus aranensis TaxID=890420 RepID=A0A1G8Y7J8_9EURY|nr:DnaJ domain-containing protein [Halovenus aranensis]SDJ98703.1 DnaJ domain-containing protein [Halovenus aranensis]